MTHGVKIPKAYACRLWWAFLILIAMGFDGVALLVNLPVLLLIAWSHIKLCRQQTTPITLGAILQYAFTLVTQLMARWSSRTGRW
jgi:hypothetical protein